MSDPQQYTNNTDPRFAKWRKSTRSNGAEGCLYISTTGGDVAVADSKAGPTSPILVSSRAAFVSFVAAVKVGALSA